MARLDALLGRVQMYRLVSIVLGVVALVALGESLIGVLGFPPLDLLATLATVLVASVVANIRSRRSSRHSCSFSCSFPQPTRMSC
jgi:hypothetical protein